MPRQRRLSQNWLWGSKLPHMQNLRGGFVVFFLGGQNRKFEKVRGLKLLLNLKKKCTLTVKLNYSIERQCWVVSWIWFETWIIKDESHDDKRVWNQVFLLMNVNLYVIWEIKNVYMLTWDEFVENFMWT